MPEGLTAYHLAKRLADYGLSKGLSKAECEPIWDGVVASKEQVDLMAEGVPAEWAASFAPDS